jgi:hypothetical protein
VIIGASVGGAIAAFLLVGGVLFFECRSRKSAGAAAGTEMGSASPTGNYGSVSALLEQSNKGATDQYGASSLNQLS